MLFICFFFTDMYLILYSTDKGSMVLCHSLGAVSTNVSEYQGPIHID